MSPVAAPLSQNHPVANIRKVFISRCRDYAGNSSKVN
jgi:hypothetical protein